MNPEATPVLGSARLETVASAVRAALLTHSVPFHRQQGSQRRIKVLIAAFSHCFLTIRVLDPRKMISKSSTPSVFKITRQLKLTCLLGKLLLL